MLDFEDEFVPAQEIRGVRGKHSGFILGGESNHNKNRRSSLLFFEEDRPKTAGRFDFEDIAEVQEVQVMDRSYISAADNSFTEGMT